MNTVQLLLQPTPGRLEYTVRLGVICALTTFLVEYHQTPEPALTAYLAFFLNKPDRFTSIVAQIVMLLLMTVVIGIIILVAMRVVDTPFWRVTSMAVISITLLFLGSSSKLKPVAGTLALIIGYCLDLLRSAEIGELAVRGLLYAWLLVAMPAAASLLVNLLVAPSPGDCVRRKILERLAVSRAFLQAPTPAGQGTLQALLAEGNEPIAKWLKLAAVEHSMDVAEMRTLRAVADFSVELMALLTLLPIASGHDLAGLGSRYAGKLDALSGAIRKRRTALLQPERPAEPLPVEDEFSRLLIARLDESFHTLAEGNPADAPVKEKPPHRGFFLPDAFSNPGHIHFALKTTAAAMACYLLYSLLDWPGIHTCFITCYIVSQDTTGESVQKLRLRMVGCLFGAGLGLAVMLTVMPITTTIEALLFIVFAGTLPAAWVAAGSPRIAYAGFQIAFAFFLCVIQGNSPEFDMTLARDRVVGILLGNFVAYVIMTGIWPVSIGASLDSKLLSLLQGLEGLARSADPRNWRLRGPALFASAARLRRDLELARLEPRSIRPTAEELDLRSALVSAAIQLNEQLLLKPSDSELTDPARVNETLQHLNAELALRLSGKGSTAPRDIAPENPGQMVDPKSPPISQTLSVMEHVIGRLGPIGHHPIGTHA